MAHALARRALSQSPLARTMTAGLFQMNAGSTVQSRQKSSHAENTNHFIVEVQLCVSEHRGACIHGMAPV